MEIQFKIKNDVDANFIVNICSFNYYPIIENISTYEKKICTNNLQNANLQNETNTETNYTIFTYLYETNNNADYLAIHLENLVALDFLSVYVNSTQNIFDIKYNAEYTLNVSKWPGTHLPSNKSYFFRVLVLNNEKMKIQFKVKKDAIINFKVKFCSFKGYPINEKILLGDRGRCENNLQSIESVEGNYITYTYLFETNDNEDYLAIHMKNFLALDFLSVYVFSKIEMEIGTILLIVLLPFIIFCVIVFCILRKYGFLTFGISSQQIKSL